jgi:hypothetical protein
MARKNGTKMQTFGSREVGRVSKLVSVSSGVRVVLLMIILTLGWAAIAQAQEGPYDDEYGNPAPIPTVTATDTGGSPVAATDTGGSPVAAAGVAGVTGVLPSTGGATLFTLGAGVLLVGSGLVARRVIR